jgi:hypothetical protein
MTDQNGPSPDWWSLHHLQHTVMGELTVKRRIALLEDPGLWQLHTARRGSD